MQVVGCCSVGGEVLECRWWMLQCMWWGIRMEGEGGFSAGSGVLQWVVG